MMAKLSPLKSRIVDKMCCESYVARLKAQRIVEKLSFRK